jgi:hypothetical protein
MSGANFFIDLSGPVQRGFIQHRKIRREDEGSSGESDQECSE